MPIDAGHVNALGTERISKLIIRYSMPTMLSTVVNASYNVADRIFVGRMCGEDGCDDNRARQRDNDFNLPRGGEARGG